MADLVARLKLANSEFNSSIDSSKQKVKQFQDTADDASKSLDDMGKKGARSASDMLKEMGKIENGARSVSDYKRQLAQLQKQIVDLTVNYRSMSAEMQNSAKGMEIKGLLDEATQHAAILKDAIGDVSNEIKNLSSDTAAWDGMKMGIDTVSSALQAFVATGVLGEQSTEKLVAVIAKLKAAEAATNAVIKVGNALQKNSALMASIATIQSKALARAKDLETAATGKATIAQKIFNAVAKANPYVLLATAILAVVGAIAAFTLAAKKNKDQLDKTRITQEAYNKALDKAKEESSTTIAKFVLLQQQYKNLRTEGDKKKWIQENADAFKELGYKIEDVNTADEVFIKHAADVVRAMELRARAAAIMQVYQEKYAEAYRKSLDLEAKGNKKPSTPQLSTANLKEAGLEYGKDYTNRVNPAPVPGGVSIVTPVLTDEGKAKWEAYWKGKGEEAKTAVVEGMSGMLDEATSLIAEAEKLDAKWRIPVGSSGGGGGKGKPEVKPDEGSLAAAQNLVNELQTQLNNMSPDNAKFEETKQKLEDAKAEVERIQNIINKTKTEAKKDPVEIFTPNSMAEAQHFVQVFQKQLNELDPNSEEFEEILDLLNIWKKRQQEITDKVNGTAKAAKTVREYQEIINKADAINLQFKIGAITQADAQKIIDDLNKELADLGLKVTVKLEVDEQSVKTTADELRDFVDSMDRVASIGGAVNALNSVYESIRDLGDKMDEAKNGWEEFMVVFNLANTIFSATAQLIETVATVTEILTAVKEANAAATNKEAASSMSNAAAKGAEAGANITAAAAAGAAAGAEGASAVASVPYVGPILAIAAIASIMAAIIAMIATAKGFANGGIVDAASKYGDKNLVRVNGGEMILNQKQQDNLFKMIDEGRQDNNSNIGGDVHFRIQGSDLVGTLNNYNHKKSKI